MTYGEQYAQAINASWFVPTCGTVAKEVVRKHFEIPGSKACLVTEKSASLEAAGFIDMQNCVFVNEKDVLDKVNFLINNPDKLREITDAGYNLVHAHHTFKQRNQIYQWYKLNKILKPHQKIAQLNPFKDLEVIDTKNDKKDTCIKCNGLHLRLLRKGESKI